MSRGSGSRSPATGAAASSLDEARGPAFDDQNDLPRGLRSAAPSSARKPIVPEMGEASVVSIFIASETP